MLFVLAFNVLVWLACPALLLTGARAWIVRPLWSSSIVEAVAVAASASAVGISWIAWLQMGDSWRLATVDAALPLVTTGVFGRIRHPIYAMQACLLLATGALVASPLIIGLAVVHLPMLALKAAIEERHLLGVQRQHAILLPRLCLGILAGQLDGSNL